MKVAWSNAGGEKLLVSGYILKFELIVVATGLFAG